ncbi:Tn3 family transposase [Streptomyces coffeae]|uniref:Tn3 family transposase n=1 Tax=Streptomyces coffeae TaxID=621382 RepID=A0ABS1NQT3_9ACTN|nr:Tn3 family transposase [Streptomyces coffeae]MBL1102462.1 Tn3 family transposase [Streptomyces coffeae]
MRVMSGHAPGGAGPQQLLRYLFDAPLRRRVTAATNKVEAFNRFSQWIGFGNGDVITDNDPVEQEKTAKPAPDGYGQAACPRGRRRRQGEDRAHPSGRQALHANASAGPRSA